jgi:hypothetical protein
MNVVVGSRGTGKTMRMLAWMRAAPEGEHRVLVAHSRDYAMQLYRDNPDLESWQFVGPEEVKPGAWSGVTYRRGGRIVLGFDNLDLWLQRQMRWEVGAVSLTAENDDAADWIVARMVASPPETPSATHE